MKKHWQVINALEGCSLEEAIAELNAVKGTIERYGMPLIRGYENIGNHNFENILREMGSRPVVINSNRTSEDEIKKVVVNILTNAVSESTLVYGDNGNKKEPAPNNTANRPAPSAKSTIQKLQEKHMASPQIISDTKIKKDAESVDKIISMLGYMAESGEDSVDFNLTGMSFLLGVHIINDDVISALKKEGLIIEWVGDNKKPIIKFPLPEQAK